MAEFNQVNLAEIYGNIDRARANQAAQQNSAMQQQQMQYEMQKQRDADMRQEQLRGVYSGAVENVDGAPMLNEKRLLADLYKVDPVQALEVQDKFTQRDATKAKTQSEAKKAELAQKIETSKYFRDRLATATDQASYDAVLMEAEQMGAGFVNGAPRAFNPEWTSKQIYTADDFIKKAENDLNRGVQMRGQDITMRGQDLTRDTTIRGQDLSASTARRGQDMANARAVEKNAIDASAGGYSTKPLPATALKMQTDALDKLSIASNNTKKLLDVKKQIEDGKLNLGLISNLEGNFRNRVGMSTESSRNLSSFKSTLEKLRNDSLRLNTGVQTDGDAQRAWNELFENINDQELVKQRLGEIAEINKRGVELQKLQVENIRGNYNAAPVDFNKYEVNPQVNSANTGSPIMPKGERMPTKPTVSNW